MITIRNFKPKIFERILLGENRLTIVHGSFAKEMTSVYIFC